MKSLVGELEDERSSTNYSELLVKKRILEQKRNELALNFLSNGNVILGTPHTFKAGWDACAKEYEKENAELKKQLEIAKKALIEINVTDEAIWDKWVSEYHLRDIAKEALKELESAGE